MYISGEYCGCGDGVGALFGTTGAVGVDVECVRHFEKEGLFRR